VQEFKMLLTSDGILPRNEYLSNMSHAWSWSLYYISDAPNFVFLILLFHFATILAFLIGYKTRLVTAILWIMTVSLHNRNWFILNGGDDLVRCTLLICIFLPLGKSLSIDAYLNKSKIPPEKFSYFSWINFCYIYQLGCIYVISSLFKYHPIWRSEFTALDYALHLDMFVRPFGIWIREHYFILKIMTAATIFLEIYGPFFLLFALFKKLFTFSRYTTVLIFISFHLGIDLMMNVGPFPYYAISFWLAFLPADFWKQHVRIIYNLKQKLEYLSLHVTIPALKNIATYSLIPMLIFLPLLIYWPLNDLKNEKLITTSWINYNDTLLSFSRWMHTYQNWKLFAPFPKNNNVWFQIIGELSSGKQINLHLQNDQIADAYPDPADVNQQFYSENIRKMFLSLEDSEKNRLLMAKYYCRSWNTHKNRFTEGVLKSVEIKFYGQRNLASGKTEPPLKSVLLKHICTSP
jgi:hypothetical protein